MTLIFNNDIESLKSIGIKFLNLNFLEQTPANDLDSKITPLIYASYLGKYDLTKLLLENPSIDIDMASSDIGHTPLTTASITGNYEILKLLIEKGAEVNKPTLVNTTPFVCCFMRLEEE